MSHLEAKNLAALMLAVVVVLLAGCPSGASASPSPVTSIHLTRVSGSLVSDGRYLYTVPASATAQTATLWDSHNNRTVPVTLPAGCAGTTPAVGGGVLFFVCDSTGSAPASTGWIYGIGSRRWIQVPPAIISASCGADPADCYASGTGSPWVAWDIAPDCGICSDSGYFYNYRTGASTYLLGSQRPGGCLLVVGCYAAALSTSRLSLKNQPCAPLPPWPYEPLSGGWIALSSSDALYLQKCGSTSRKEVATDAFPVISGGAIVLWRAGSGTNATQISGENAVTGRTFTLSVTGAGAAGFNPAGIVGDRLYGISDAAPGQSASYIATLPSSL